MKFIRLILLLLIASSAYGANQKYFETSLSIIDKKPFAEASSQPDKLFYWKGYGGAPGLPGTIYHDISELSRTQSASKIHLIVIYAPSIKTPGWLIDRTFDIPFDKDTIEKIGHDIEFRVHISPRKTEQGATANP